MPVEFVYLCIQLKRLNYVCIILQLFAHATSETGLLIIFRFFFFFQNQNLNQKQL